MINNTPAQYVFIRTCILLLGAIVPVSVVGTVCCTVAPWLEDIRSLPAIPLPLRIYFVIETIFWIGFQLPLYYNIQKEAVLPPPLSEKDRRKLFTRVIKDVEPSEIEHHIRWWFRGAKIDDIGRDGVKDWLAWAFFEGRIDVSGVQYELEDYAGQLEHLCGKSFGKGYGKAKPIRLTLDKVELRGFRSLTWYFMVGFVDLLTFVRLCCIGYKHYRAPLKCLLGLFPFRPVALTTRQTSPTEHLSYWYRPHTAKDRLPVVFVHGIGIGMYPYVNFLHEICHEPHSTKDKGQVGVIALEIMPVAFRVTHAALDKDVMCHEINAILEHHGWDKCVVVGHSYGTIIATHMVYDKILQPKISSVLFVDPVCFLLHNPDVAYNFTVRRPKQANEWQLWYFASQDPGVAHTLGRRFFWSENVLWLEDLLSIMESTGMRVTVSLAGRDLIVNTEAVGKYLSGAIDCGNGTSRHGWKCRAWKGVGLEAIWNEERDHAQVFDFEEDRAKLVEVVKTYCGWTE